MSASMQNEIALLEQYNSEIEALGERFAEADSQSKKPLQKQLDQKLQIYWKQVQLVKTQFPDAVEGRVHESAFYTFQAMTKLFSAGLLRRVSGKASNLYVGAATGLIAKQQEKSNAKQSLTMLDQALNVYDYPGAHIAKAEIYRALNQKEDALRELNYIIANFQDDKAYLSARQIKDEIENPPKKGMCFVATAAYGSPLAPEVVVLSRYRDEVLLTSKLGTLFVKTYYFVSPPLANLIAAVKPLRAGTRLFLLKPILWLLKNRSRF